MKLLVISSLLCILLLIFSVEGRRPTAKPWRRRPCCPRFILHGRTPKAPRLSQESQKTPALLVPPEPWTRRPSTKHRAVMPSLVSESLAQQRARPALCE
ncbi:uncharacterized protein LOC131481703 isoform X2 [Ochotona princeps]|uniref:uncharacterized protein LOC131481703 isoform X2 n=1 Tax=Ochotona princeps TaxID=9978 RepID=UPI00271533CA|nr:uncharacterized protein LOC131481703 isoform X2 [Ochotona princeps]